jgi:hypothetical protein
VAEEHRRPQGRVVVEVVVRLGQAEEGVRVEPVVDLGPIDPDQDDLAAPLDGDLGRGGERNVGMRPLSLSVGMAISHLVGDGIDEPAETFDLVFDRHIRNFDYRAADDWADASYALGGRVLVDVNSDEWHCALLSFRGHHNRPPRFHDPPTTGFSTEMSLAADCYERHGGRSS